VVDSYAGTQIGADGRRYTTGDPDLPTTPSAHPGKLVTTRSLQAEVLDDLGDLSALLERAVVATTVADDATLLLTTGTFTPQDVGAIVVGDGIPEGATIASVTDTTHAELSDVATVSDTGVDVSLTRNLSTVVHGVLDDLGDMDSLLVRTVTDGVLNSTTTVTSATAAFTAADVGAVVTATGVPAGTTIASRTNATTVVLSAAATATATGVTVKIERKLAKVVDVLEV
jgi:hypothetical protein